MRKRIALSVLLVAALFATAMPAVGATSSNTSSIGAPQLTVSSPTNGSASNEPTLTISGRTNGEAVQVVADDATITAPVAADGEFSVPVVLREGPNTIVITTRLGGSETTITRTVVLDREPPRIRSFVARQAVFSTSTSSRKRIARYGISEKSHVVATIATRVGRRLRVLHQSVVRPSHRAVQWNGRTRRGRLVKSGVYRLTLTARDVGGNVTSQSRNVRILVRNDSRIARVLRTAFRFRGVPYVWGGMSPQGFDCSGFVGYVYRLNGVRLPRTSREMAHAGRRVSSSRLRPADILLFNTGGGGISHAGLYLGHGRFINASSGSGGVVIASLRRGSWYRSRLVTARRVLP